MIKSAENKPAQPVSGNVTWLQSRVTSAQTAFSQLSQGQQTNLKRAPVDQDELREYA